MFGTKNDEGSNNESDHDEEVKETPKKRTKVSKKAESDQTQEGEAPAKRKRRTKFEIQAEKLEKELLTAKNAEAAEEASAKESKQKKDQ